MRWSRIAAGAGGAALVAAVVLTATPATAGADAGTTLYVDQNGSATTGCTAPGASACQTISEGVTAAEALSDDVTIDVAASATSYDENVVINDTTNPTLTIAGAGATTTTLDGGQHDSDVDIEFGTVTISGMTLTNGNASQNGGAVDNADSVTLTNDTLSNNHASNGGGVYNNGSATLTDDKLTNDTATGDGGGVDDNEGVGDTTLTATNVTFTLDTAGRGGGVFNGGGFTITGSTFSSDSANQGGGLANFANGELDSSTLSDDKATGSNGIGGGVYNESAHFTAKNDTFAGDTATGNGGGIDSIGTTTVTSSTISGNSALNGGGVANGNGFVTLTNDTLTNNSANTGDGGDLLVGSHATLLDDTIASGLAADGPGIYDSNTLTVTSSVISGAACDTSTGNAVTDGGYNVESDKTCGLTSSLSKTGNAAIDLATALAANGSTGPQTLAITSASSAVDIVPSSLCTQTPTDERGDARPGITSQTFCDAGAFEFQGTATKPPVTKKKPSAPRSPKAKAGKKAITVSWKAPASNGGDKITAYDVYCSLKKKVSTKGKACAKATGTHLSVVVKKLKAKKKYYVVVVAVNAKGASPASAVVSATTKK